MLRHSCNRILNSASRIPPTIVASHHTPSTLLEAESTAFVQLPSLSSWFADSWARTLHSRFAGAASSPKRGAEAGEGDKATDGAGQQAAHEAAASQQAEEASQEEGGASNGYAEWSREELHEALSARDGALASSIAQADEMTERVKRTLADMENLRQRTAKQAENSQKFAIQGFLKSLLDVGDNLERAYTAVPAEALQGKDPEGGALAPEKLVKILNGIVNGLQLTDKIFHQALRENGVEQFRPEGEKFDPNLHDALFEMPDPSKDPGTIGAVTKTGYTLNGRVVRPAQVGVVRAPS